jgi:uncharacterized membrane protein
MAEDNDQAQYRRRRDQQGGSLVPAFYVIRVFQMRSFQLVRPRADRCRAQIGKAVWRKKAADDVGRNLTIGVLMIVPAISGVAPVLRKAATPAMGIGFVKGALGTLLGDSLLGGLPSSTRIAPTRSGSPNR